MIKEEDFQKLKSIPENIQKIIKKHSYLTGSMKFNCFSENSDYDLLMHPDFFEEPDYIMLDSFSYSDTSYDPDENFSSLYVRLNDKCLNLLIFDDENEYKIWKKATDIFCSLCQEGGPFYDSVMINKKIRTQFFKNIKDYVEND